MNPSRYNQRQALARMFGLQTSVETVTRQAAADGSGAVDRLTGLPDAAALRRVYSHLAMQALRTGAPLSVALLALDTPRLLARRGGAALIEHATATAARRLSSTFRASDVFARWSDDQFVGLFPGTDVGGAVRAVEKAMISFHGQPILDPDWEALDLGFSAAVVPAELAAPFSESLQQASRLLARSADGGPDRIYWPLGELAPLARRVLLVGGDEEISAAVASVFSEPGDAFVGTPRLEDAIGAVERILPRMLVLDLSGAPERGFAVLAMLRRISVAAGIPIVVIGSDENQLARSFALGADDFLPRPVRVEELHARTGRLLRRRARLSSPFSIIENL